MKARLLHLVVLFLALGLGACSTSITGHVFLDSNGNNQVDAGEKGIQGLRYTVTQDGKSVEENLTAGAGKYLVRASTSGKYCIELDQNSLKGLDSDDSASLSASAIMEILITPTKPPVKSVSVFKEETSITSPPSDPYAKPPPPATPDGTTTISDFSGCIQVGFRNETMDIPVQLDISATLNEIPAPKDIIAAAGEKFDLKLTWPQSCNLQPFQIPDEIMSADEEIGVSSDGVAPMLALSGAVAPDSSVQGATVIQDAMASKVVHLKVRSDVTGGKLNHSFQPKVLCDETLYFLPAQKLIITAKPTLTVAQNLKGNPALGATLTNEITIANNGKQSVTGAKLIVSFSNAVQNVSVSGSAACSNLGITQSCMLTLAPGETQVLTVQFSLPGKLEEKEEYVIGATLKPVNQDNAVEADKITFWLFPA